ncbi:MAG: hypothetical protein EXX96DRAFT_550939 [Benjaminiella poitrasii]|nr:MAG: hypothetical protein EXX96DRAFT_550939 [Benjaminiella poitrasii]
MRLPLPSLPPNSNANDDLFKLSIELQILLNRLVNVGINFPVVFGTLFYGFNCDIFKMNLKAPVIYRIIKSRACFIPRDLNNFKVVRNILTSLSQLRSLVQIKVEKAKKSKPKLSKCLTWIKEPVINYKDPDRK